MSRTEIYMRLSASHLLGFLNIYVGLASVLGEFGTALAAPFNLWVAWGLAKAIPMLKQRL